MWLWGVSVRTELNGRHAAGVLGGWQNEGWGGWSQATIGRSVRRESQKESVALSHRVLDAILYFI